MVNLTIFFDTGIWGLEGDFEQKFPENGRKWHFFELCSKKCSKRPLLEVQWSFNVALMGWFWIQILFSVIIVSP